MMYRVGIAAALSVSMICAPAAPARADDDSESETAAGADRHGAPVVDEDYTFEEGRESELARWSFLAHLGGGLRLADSGWPEEANYTYYGIATGGALFGATARRRLDEQYVAQGRLVFDYAPYSAQGLSPVSFSTGYYHAWSTQLELGVLKLQPQDDPFFFGGGIIIGARHFTGSFESVPSGLRDYGDSLWVMVLGITAEAGLMLDDEQRFEVLLRVPLQVSGLSGSGLTEVGFTALFGARVF